VRGIRRLGLVLAAPCAVTMLLAVTVPGDARAAGPLYGHDVSWPQCPTSAGGVGLPMPPETSQFVVLGLTRGLPFTDNPCLADQLGWTRAHGLPAHAYTIPAFPTPAQLEADGGTGPWAADEPGARLRNAGHAQARHALATLARVGFSPPTVWIDVEARPAQPWPAATEQQQLDNRAVLDGVIRGLADAHLAYGFYASSAGWRSITGSWQLPGTPVWATAGRLDHPEEARDLCTSPSFSGGPVLIAQWFDDERDYDLTCTPDVFP
jgi:hypothetical protein